MHLARFKSPHIVGSADACFLSSLCSVLPCFLPHLFFCIRAYGMKHTWTCINREFRKLTLPLFQNYILQNVWMRCDLSKRPKRMGLSECLKRECLESLNGRLLFEKENCFRQFIHKTPALCTIGIFSVSVLRLCNVWLIALSIRMHCALSYCHRGTCKRVFLLKTHATMTCWEMFVPVWMTEWAVNVLAFQQFWPFIKRMQQCYV